MRRLTHPGADTAVTSPDGREFGDVEFELEEATMTISMIFLEASVVLHIVESCIYCISFQQKGSMRVRESVGRGVWLMPCAK